MLGASSYNIESKYYLHLRSTEGQWHNVLKAFRENFPFILVIRERTLGTFFWSTG